MGRSIKSGSVRVEFRATLPYRLTSVLTLLASAARYEGFDQQLYVTHAALPLDLRRDIELSSPRWPNRWSSHVCASSLHRSTTSPRSPGGSVN